jgi:hypothetical protein
MRAGIHRRLSRTYCRQGVMVIVFVVEGREFVSGDNHPGFVMDLVDGMYTGAIGADSLAGLDLD